MNTTGNTTGNTRPKSVWVCNKCHLAFENSLDPDAKCPGYYGDGECGGHLARYGMPGHEGDPLDAELAKVLKEWMKERSQTVHFETSLDDAIAFALNAFSDLGDLGDNVAEVADRWLRSREEARRPPS